MEERRREEVVGWLLREAGKEREKGRERKRERERDCTWIAVVASASAAAIQRSPAKEKGTARNKEKKMVKELNERHRQCTTLCLSLEGRN